MPKGKGKGQMRQRQTQPVKKKLQKGKGKGKNKGKGPQRGKNGYGGAVMKNGEKLCAAFNEGKCTDPEPCPNGSHRCNAFVDKSKRVCGMRSHNRMACTNEVRV